MRLFGAMEIRDAIGALADGRPVEAELVEVVRAALNGPVETADRGQQVFVVGVFTADLSNVDTEEIIWPRPVGHVPSDGDVLLTCVTSETEFHAERERWMEEDPVAWTAFVWRVAVPLANRLGLRLQTW